MRTAILTMIALTALLSGAARAEPGPFRLALNLSSLGVGPELSYRPSRWFALRGAASLLSISGHRDLDGIRYDGRVRLRNYGLLADVHPFGNGWRISGGVGGNGNRVRLKARPMSAVTVGNTTYTPAQIGTLSGEVATRDVAPIATIGYGGPLASHFAISGDVGVMFHGRPRMSALSSTTTLIAPADLAAERDQIQQDVRKYRFYPVVQISAGYRF